MNRQSKFDGSGAAEIGDFDAAHNSTSGGLSRNSGGYSSSPNIRVGMDAVLESVSTCFINRCQQFRRTATIGYSQKSWRTHTCRRVAGRAVQSRRFGRNQWHGTRLRCYFMTRTNSFSVHRRAWHQWLGPGALRSTPSRRAFPGDEVREIVDRAAHVVGLGDQPTSIRSVYSQPISLRRS